MDNQFFKNIEKKTGVKMQDVMNLAGSLQNANLKMKIQCAVSLTA